MDKLVDTRGPSPLPLHGVRSSAASPTTTGVHFGQVAVKEDKKVQWTAPGGIFTLGKASSKPHAVLFVGIQATVLLLLLFSFFHISLRSHVHASENQMSLSQVMISKDAGRLSTPRRPPPTSTPQPTPSAPPAKPRARTKQLIIARHDEDASCLDVFLDDIPHIVYQVDDGAASHQVPRNSGNEAMAYLTYIIENYEDLPDAMLFLHAHRSAWHTGDNVWVAKNINWFEFSYATTQCNPPTRDWLFPGNLTLRDDPAMAVESKRYAEAWPSLFGGELGALPTVVETPCCAQFLVSKDAVLAHKMEWYVHLRRWLVDTNWPSHYSGRLFEYGWHMMFGQPAKYGGAGDYDDNRCMCILFNHKCESVPPRANALTIEDPHSAEHTSTAEALIFELPTPTISRGSPPSHT